MKEPAHMDGVAYAGVDLSTSSSCDVRPAPPARGDDIRRAEVPGSWCARGGTSVHGRRGLRPPADRSLPIYSDFNGRLADALKKFDLTTREKAGIFDDRPPAAASRHLLETLGYNVSLASAIATEKGRSELVVAPVLVELKRALRPDISLFSGVDLPVDPAAGLTGICDFLISASPEQFFVKAPVVVVVEAKNESIRDGMGQCVVEMVASKIFNEREGNAIETVYGAVTTGQIWKFSSLTGKTLQIDMIEYLIDQPDKILGILASMVPDTR